MPWRGLDGSAAPRGDGSAAPRGMEVRYAALFRTLELEHEARILTPTSA